MKCLKRMAALLVVLALAMATLPGMALAAGATGAQAESGASSETQDATPPPTATPAPYGIKGINSYAIGTCDADGAFTAVSSIEPWTTKLVLRLYFNGSVPASAGGEIGNKAFQDFSSQGGRVATDGKTYVEITGLKYTNEKGNVFRGTIFAGTDYAYDVNLTIRECNMAISEPLTPTPTPAQDPRAPGLIVRSSSIGTNAVNAGDSFQLSLTIYATSSGTEDITDVVVSLVPEKGVVITSGSSTQYIGTMKPGTSQTVSFPMQAQPDFTEGVSTVSVSLSGTGAVTGSAAAATGTTISVPVNQPDRFEISNVEMPESMMVGEDSYLSVTFVNKGKNSVNNLTFQLDAENCAAGSQNQYVGNLAGGTEDSIDFDLSPLEAGQLNGTITVTYEAPSGEVVTLTQEISCIVEEGYSYDDPGMWEDPGMEDPGMEQDTGLPMWAKVLIGAAVVAAAVAAVVVVRKRKAKKKALLEAEDEDL